MKSYLSPSRSIEEMEEEIYERAKAKGASEEEARIAAGVAQVLYAPTPDDLCFSFETERWRHAKSLN